MIESNMVEPNNVLQLFERVRYREINEEGVLLNMESGRVIVVNQTGLRIVELLKKPTTKGEIIENLVQEFDIGIKQVTADVDEYLTELNKENIINSVC